MSSTALSDTTATTKRRNGGKALHQTTGSSHNLGGYAAAVVVAFTPVAQAAQAKPKPPEPPPVLIANIPAGMSVAELMEMSSLDHAYTLEAAEKLVAESRGILPDEAIFVIDMGTNPPKVYLLKEGSLKPYKGVQKPLVKAHKMVWRR